MGLWRASQGGALAHGVLLWLAQLSDKSWMTPSILGDFVAGINELIGLRNPSSTAGDDKITVLPVYLLKSPRVAAAKERQSVSTT
jgi:hypothetical protein